MRQLLDESKLDLDYEDPGPKPRGLRWMMWCYLLPLLVFEMVALRALIKGLATPSRIDLSPRPTWWAYDLE